MGWKLLAGISVITVGVALANVAARALTPGLADVDDFAIWMFKAKIVAHEPVWPVPAVLLDPALSFSHQDYPLSFPLLVASPSEMKVPWPSGLAVPSTATVATLTVPALMAKLPGSSAHVLTGPPLSAKVARWELPRLRMFPAPGKPGMPADMKAYLPPG